jgi:2-polyprenyl-3-methyl-5-hydroxy-6-metoxy-1,4-benzoquinol methylase
MIDHETIAREETPWAERLAAWQAQRWPRQVIDLGAGWGVYVQALRAAGVVAWGVDTTQPQPRPDLVETRSLTQVGEPQPAVMCLEVAEHLPITHSALIVDAIWRWCRPGGVVMFSAAQPGQGGSGHINCQPREFWSDLAQQQGFELDLAQQAELVNYARAGYHMGWFVQNVQIWRRPRML